MQINRHDTITFNHTIPMTREETVTIGVVRAFHYRFDNPAHAVEVDTAGFGRVVVPMERVRQVVVA